NEEKYQYTGFTKEAIHKTQNVGYQNEYYYLAGNVTNINNYRKYYEPLIKKDSKNFKEGMKKANEATNFKAKIEVVSTLFSTKSDFTKNNSKKDLLFLSDDLYHYKEKPENTNITLQLSEPKINSTRAFYDANNPLEYGVHKHE
ncbi:MAG: DUF1672 domain-containing protein, partial [Staphylococcus epidermidis]|nr:DUF1672 domain-containing protein [Staphylococcus epidermidis]